MAKGLNRMNKPHTQQQIADICGKCRKTVHNWQKNNSTPKWALERLGYKITPPTK